MRIAAFCIVILSYRDVSASALLEMMSVDKLTAPTLFHCLAPTGLLYMGYRSLFQPSGSGQQLAVGDEEEDRRDEQVVLHTGPLRLLQSVGSVCTCRVDLSSV